MKEQVTIICPWCGRKTGEMREIENVKDFISYEICEGCKKKAIEKVKEDKRKEEKAKEERKRGRINTDVV